MQEIKLTVEIPGLVEAINALSAAGGTIPSPVAAASAASSPLPSAVAAPVAPERSYEFSDIQVAATALADTGADKREEVLALMSRFNIPALSSLPTEQYGAFATALRALGAKI